ncbi:MAG: sensor histidine kinase [Opitutales bacterium]|nr:sensor histidine kinase [Opitutales bacterium]
MNPTPADPSIALRVKKRFTKEHWAHYDNDVLLEFHSFLNLLSVFYTLLDLHRSEFPSAIPIDKPIAKCVAISRMLHESSPSSKKVLEESMSFLRDMKSLIQSMPEGVETCDILREVYKTFELRVDEMLERQKMEDDVVDLKPNEVAQNLKQFFLAVERNSHGRYHVVYDVKDQQSMDYVVTIILQPNLTGIFRLPAVVTDCIRDLAANARKYTNPGGSILIKLTLVDGHYQLIVEDNGKGIPGDEIEKVVNWGYRGSNVIHQKTMGEGLGLTKALSVAARYNGYLEVESVENHGTKVTLSIPES